jgi:hypothetical protein
MLWERAMLAIAPRQNRQPRALPGAIGVLQTRHEYIPVG